jgi:hypothetical protein
MMMTVFLLICFPYGEEDDDDDDVLSIDMLPLRGRQMPR